MNARRLVGVSHDSLPGIGVDHVIYLATIDSDAPSASAVVDGVDMISTPKAEKAHGFTSARSAAMTA